MSDIDSCKKYIEDKGATINLRHIPKLDVLEIELTSFCNCNCNNCNRFVDSAPTTDMMSLEQIEKFVKESNNLNYRWTDIRVMGGEPTLHPDIIEILKLLKTLKNTDKVRLITNGTGSKVNAVLDEIKNQNLDIPISNSFERYDACEKVDGKLQVRDYRNMLSAPVDRIKHISTCQITATCGLGLNKYGFLPCGCGAAIGRVLNLDFFFKSLKDITIEECNDKLAILCPLCGANYSHILQLEDNNEMSEFWQESLKNYSDSNDLTLY